MIAGTQFIELKKISKNYMKILLITKLYFDRTKAFYCLIVLKTISIFKIIYKKIEKR